MKKPPSEPTELKKPRTLFGVNIGQANAANAVKILEQRCLNLLSKKTRFVTHFHHQDPENIGSPLIRTRMSTKRFGEKHGTNMAATSRFLPPDEDKRSR